MSASLTYSQTMGQIGTPSRSYSGPGPIGSGSTSVNITEDSLDSLPVDQNVPSPNEVHILDTLFKKKHSVVQKILLETKDVMLVGFLFIIFSLPQVDEIIKKLIPMTNTSVYIAVLVKSVGFMILYFLVKNLYLVRK